jgi:DNA primase
VITKNTIDKVFEAARVEEVIGDYVQLKRAGSNLKGLSPFSSEKSPSFMVSPVKQIWKDFSSGKGGNAVTFLMEHEHFTYPDAIRHLAKKYNIEIEETEDSQEEKQLASERESLYVVSEFAADYFEKTLHNTEVGKAIGLSYFKERGFSTETIKKFKLGYSPEVWDALTVEALGKGYQLEFLEKTGLTIVGDQKPFDRFKGRVMFPIQSMSGRVMGFGGRILDNEKKAAKYLNSPESDIYYKSKVLYGIYHAKAAIAKQDNCFLVEGYTDVIQFNQAGIENVVASSGTALTPDQIRLVQRLTKNMTVLFDGDAAGLRASIRGIDLILEAGMNVKVCTFPDGEDPDSFAKKTPYEELLRYLDENAKDFIQFKASLLFSDAKNDPIKKAELIRDMVESISKIPDPIKREIYIKECSRIMDISEDVLFSALQQMRKKEISEADKKYKEAQQDVPFEVIKDQQKPLNSADLVTQLECKIIQTLLLYGDVVTEFTDIFFVWDDFGNKKEETRKVQQAIYERLYVSLQDDEIEFSNVVFKEIYQELINAYTQANLDKTAYIHSLDPEKMSIVSDIIMQDEKYQLHGWEEKKQVFVKDKNNPEVLANLTQELIATFREFLIARLIQNEVANLQAENPENTAQVLEQINNYNQLKVIMMRYLGRVRTG